MIVCVEIGGFIFVFVLVLKVDVLFVLVCERGKLLLLVVFMVKDVLYILGIVGNKEFNEVMIEMEVGVIFKGGKVVVVDDVFVIGKIFCVVFKLLIKVGVEMKNIFVMVVVEFLFYKGRELLYNEGFGSVSI